MFSPFFQITKVSEERREVGGLITAEKVDRDDEVMDYARSKPHFQKWSDNILTSTKNAGQEPSYGNLRLQHSKQNVGKFNSPLVFDDEKKSIWGQAFISDDDAWEKVKNGEMTGFSVGGRLAEPIRKVNGKNYLAIVPMEISLVDYPACDAATFDYIRAADGQVQKVAFKSSDPKYRLKSAVNELLAAVKFLSPELAPTAEQVNAPGAIEPVPNPPQDGAEVASRDLAYAPDAVPDGRKPEATQPIDSQAHMSAEPRKYDAIPALVVAAPDTQLGKHDSEPKAEMIGLDGANKVADAVEKHDKPEEPATMGTAVTPDPGIEVTPIGHKEEQFGLRSDDPDPNAFHDETTIEKVSPPGWSDTVEAMKEHPEIDNPWALAWWMDSEGYTPHKMSKAAAIEFQAAYTKFAEAFASEKRAVSDKERADLADKGKAMPDGSYPIANESDLHNAIQAFGRAKNKPAVKAHIKRRAKELGKEGALPDSWKAAGTAEKQISKLSTGANQMANEVAKGARLSLTDHLGNMKMKAAKHAQDISDMCDKCMKLAGGPAFDADTETDDKPEVATSGDVTGATDTEVKAASAQIEKLSGLVEKLTAKIAELEKAPAPKAEEKKEAEKSASSETVVGDRSKAAPVKAEVTVEKLSADAKEQEEHLKLWKAANGIRTETIVLDGKAVERNLPCAPDLNARNAMYSKLTNSKLYMTAGRVARPAR